MTVKDQKNDILSPEEWLELVEHQDATELRNKLMELHPADVAAIVEQIPYELQAQIFSLIEDEEIAAEVAAELDELTQSRLFSTMSPTNVAGIVENLDSDDAADLLAVLSDAHAGQIIDNLTEDARMEVEELLGYHEDSAGGIMAKEAVEALVTDTVGEVIIKLRAQAEEVEDVYNIYLLDDNRVLMGLISLKDLILAENTDIVAAYMDGDFVKVNVNLDQEEVSELFRRYDLASIPVIDDNGEFLGRVTHDDIIDVIHEEAEEDFAHLTGHSTFDPGETSLIRNIKHRLPWLLIGLTGGLVAATVLSGFAVQLSRTTTLVFFLPMVAAMGGNAGIQTSSLMVRGLATGEIGEFGRNKRLMRELVVACFTGLACAITVFIVSLLWKGDMVLSTVVAISLLIVVVSAAFVGVLIPLTLSKFNIDPALATGPFITTSNDVIGLLIYLGIAHLLFNMYS
ncbi:magnesium transporter [Calditrichota bacterium]